MRVQKIQIHGHTKHKTDIFMKDHLKTNLIHLKWKMFLNQF